MRPMWSGAVSFGLIYIPVNMYKATEEQNPGFHLISSSDHCPIKYKRVCKYNNKEVPYSDIQKSFEYEKGKNIIIEEKDLQRAYSKRSEAIKILEFVKKEDILPKYFQQPYYLEPQKGAEKVYALLVEALKRSGKVGITRYTLHSLEHLGVLQSEESLLLLQQIRFNTQVRDIKGLTIPRKIKGKKDEIDLAVSLIERLSKDFDPTKYKDNFKDDLDKIIRSKISQGKTIVLDELITEGEKGEVIDLMKRLKASIAESEEKNKDVS